MAEEIPRIIHRVWIGGPLPIQFQEYETAWRRLHPGWTVKTWKEEELDFLANQREYLSASNYAEKSDIARYEIIYRHGGVYVDCDFEPLKNIEPLLCDSELVVSEELPGVYGNAFFAAIPGHRGLRYTIQKLPESFQANMLGTIPQRTGPEHWTRSIKRSSLHMGYPFKVVPRALIYPYSYTQGHIEPDKYSSAFAVHHWAASWHTHLSIWARVAPNRLSKDRIGRLASRVARNLRQNLRALISSRASGARSHTTYLGEGRLLVGTADGTLILADSTDLEITPSLIADGSYDPPFSSFLSGLLRPGDVAVDVGSNIGLFCLQMARAVGGTGRVFAFEPNPNCVSLLRDSLYFNQLRGLSAEVNVFHLAVGNSQGRTALTAHPSHRGMGALASDQPNVDDETFDVSVVTLDRLLSSVALVRIVKIDVEGFELDVLQGMQSLITQGKIEFIDMKLVDSRSGERWEELCEILRSLELTNGARFHSLSSDGSLMRIQLIQAIHCGGLSHLIIDFSKI